MRVTMTTDLNYVMGHTAQHILTKICRNSDM